MYINERKSPLQVLDTGIQRWPPPEDRQNDTQSREFLSCFYFDFIFYLEKYCYIAPHIGA